MSPKVEAIVDKIEKLSKSQRAELADGLEVLFDLKPEVPEWAKAVYATAPEISPDDHVLMQAAFQEACDSGISKTINFPNSATKEDVEDAYMLAWKEGCKGITVYRAGSREKEVLVKGNADKSEQPTLDGFELEEQMLESNHDCEGGCNIVFESGCETCKTCGWSACLISQEVKLDKEERKNFDNTYYNHQEEMKGISAILDSQEDLKEQIVLLSEKVDKLTILYTDLAEKYVHENNQLRQELTGRR